MPPKSSTIPYIAAVVIMVLLGVVAVLVITALRPKEDNALLITTVLGFIAPTLAAIFAFMKSQETHSEVNGRLQAMVDAAREIGYAEGMAGRRGLRLVRPNDPLSPVSDQQEPT